MEYLGVGAVVIAVLALALLAAGLGIAALTKGSKRAPPVRLLPWWYIGGQPEAAIPPSGPDDEDEPRAVPSPRDDGSHADDLAPVATAAERTRN